MTVIASIAVYHNVYGEMENESNYIVDLNRLYLSFDMTNELNGKYERISNPISEEIDSLTNVIKQLETNSLKKVNVNIIRNRVSELLQMEQEAKFDFEQQIWNQLNIYIDEFGKQSKYPVILGSRNEGYILYADTKLNITDELIEFSNNKFKGK